MAVYLTSTHLIKFRVHQLACVPSVFRFNLLKSSGFFMYHQVYHSNFYMVLALRWVFCADLRTDSGICFIRY